MKRKRYIVSTQPITITRNAIAVNPLTTYNVSSGNILTQFGKSTITNLVTNGDFSNGITGWSATIATDDYYSTPAGGYKALQTSSSFTDIANVPIGNKIYVSAYVKSSSDFVSVRRFDYLTYNNFVNIGVIYPPQSTNWTRISNIFTNANTVGFRLDVSCGTSGSAYYDNVLAVDLTTTFGKGFEPTKEWCDANVSFFNGSKTIDNYNPLVTHGDTRNIVINGEPLLSIQEGKVITGSYIEVDNSHNNVAVQMMVLGI